MSYSALLTDARRERIAEVVAGRSRTTVIVLEACHDPHNVAAILRTAEALGVQEVHVVEHPSLRFRAHKRISARAEKWLELSRHASVDEAIASLQKRGYRVLAAHPEPGGATLYDFDFRKKTALLFGNEHAGVSEAARARVDGLFSIPTSGFTRSLNVSVAAAICMSHAVFFRAALSGQAGDLDPGEREALLRDLTRIGVKQHKRVDRALKKLGAPDVPTSTRRTP